MKLAPQWAKLMLPFGYDTVTIDEFWSVSLLPPTFNHTRMYLGCIR